MILEQKTELVGKKIIQLWNGIIDFFNFIFSIIKSFKVANFVHLKSIHKIVLNQTKFTGIDALPFIILLAILVGATVIIQAMTNLPKFGIERYIGNILVIIIARELGPITTVLIVVGRSSTAMATEIAVQQWSREVLSLRIMGIEPYFYIVFPRIIAFTLSMLALIIFFNIAAFLGGFAISRLTVYIPLELFFKNLMDAFTLRDLLATGVKSFVYGITVPLISSYYGFKPGSKFEIPIYVSRAVNRTLSAMIVINVIISILFYYIVF